MGNFLFYYLDIEGNIIDAPFYERLICPELEVLKKIPLKICILGTRGKINAIYGGMRGGFVDVLITDRDTAMALMRKQHIFGGFKYGFIKRDIIRNVFKNE